eukprot:2160795-Rhodomonas_salina.2
MLLQLLGRWCEGIERQLLAERYCPTPPYAMSSTYIAFDLIAAVVRAHEETGRAEVLQVPSAAISLRHRYAMPAAISLHHRYAMPATDEPYAATSTTRSRSFFSW